LPALEVSELVKSLSSSDRARFIANGGLIHLIDFRFIRAFLHFFTMSFIENLLTNLVFLTCSRFRIRIILVYFRFERQFLFLTLQIIDLSL